MTDPQEPEYLDAELVDGPAPGSSSERPKLIGAFDGLQLRDTAQERIFLAELQRMGVPISDGYVPADVAATEITATADTSYATHGPSQADRLSEVLYDIAKIAEAVNLALPPDREVPADEGYTVGERMEQIMEMIGTAPLTQQYATRLAFEK